MSRTRKGSKPVGYDWWHKPVTHKKNNGSHSNDKNIIKRKERAMLKQQLIKGSE